MDTTRLCRICLLESTYTKSLLNVGEEEEINYIHIMFEALTNSKLKVTETTPSYLCRECESNLTSSYNFQRLCLRSNENLKFYDITTSQSIKKESEETSSCFDVDVVASHLVKLEPAKMEMEEDENETSNDLCIEKTETANEFCEDVLMEDEEHLLTETDPLASQLLPERSRHIYEKEYDTFCKWKAEESVKIISEEVILSYFSGKSKLLKLSSMWTCYSMLKATLRLKENVDISKYPKVSEFMKSLGTLTKPKTLKSFDRNEFNRFLREASDEKFLMLKVAMIMGVGGGCRIDELRNMSVDDVEDRGSVIVVKVPDTKTHKGRMFAIVEDGIKCVSPVGIVRKYAALRPPDVNHGKFFLNYCDGRCTVQSVGKNSFGRMPKLIAEFLKLPNCDSYTGHCFKRSSSSFLADFDAFREKIENSDGFYGRVIRKDSAEVDDEKQLLTETGSSVSESVLTEADSASSLLQLLSEKSRHLYGKVYDSFCKWRTEEEVVDLSEDVLLLYLNEKSKQVKVSSLWTCYSMLKATLRVNENVDIGKFPKLTAFLKSLGSTTGDPKKLLSFDRNQFDRFLTEASDEKFLLLKVVMIMGVAGGCRIDDLQRITIDDVEDRSSVIVVKVPNMKTRKKRMFAIVEDGNKFVNPVEIVRRYAALRPPNVDHRKFFLNYRCSRCNHQAVGRNSFGRMPKLIAKFLKLPNEDLYTGHCFRRSSTSFLADSRPRKQGKLGIL